MNAEVSRNEANKEATGKTVKEKTREELGAINEDLTDVRSQMEVAQEFLADQGQGGLDDR
jgi:hypothetical protein